MGIYKHWKHLHLGVKVDVRYAIVCRRGRDDGARIASEAGSVEKAANVRATGENEGE